jgi:hypothetical protein
MNNRLSVGGILCDFEKDFECVDRGIVVDKLEFCEIGGKFLTVTQSYLTDRYQNIFICTINTYDSPNNR